jgi:hypothetical protein
MPGTPLIRSGQFHAPGRPLPPQRLAEVRRVLGAELQALTADHGLRLESGRDPAERLVRTTGLDLHWLCGFAEAGLKRLTRSLSADLIGGANVTRLDRTLTLAHPRLPYRRAVRIVSGRGWRLALGDELPPPAAASLVRFCGHLPVQILYLPGQPQPASLAAGRQGFHYIAPWGGQVMAADLPLPAAPGPAVCRFRLDRLLLAMLGLTAVPDAWPVAGAATAG